MNRALQRNTAEKRCNDAGIRVLPYGNGWWLVGPGVSQVVGELAGIAPESLLHFTITPR